MRDFFRQFGRENARKHYRNGIRRDETPPDPKLTAAEIKPFVVYSESETQIAEKIFISGRYGRSKARLPENIENWRATPDITNPGADLANWPNSAFTLPQGRAYLEIAPVGFYGSSRQSPQVLDSEFLIRYGLTDNVELRVFGQGETWTGGSTSRWGYSPLAFDTKIQCWTENTENFVPAMGFEAYIQTQWLGDSATNAGTQPGFSFNFDQSLPLEIDFEYNIGAMRYRSPSGTDRWDYTFQWAFQRDLFEDEFAVFIHGYINGASLPRGPKGQPMAINTTGNSTQNVVGTGFIWNLNKRVSLWGQTSMGTTHVTPAVLSYAGFSVAF